MRFLRCPMPCWAMPGICGLSLPGGIAVVLGLRAFPKTLRKTALVVSCSVQGNVSRRRRSPLLMIAAGQAHAAAIAVGLQAGTTGSQRKLSAFRGRVAHESR